MLAEVCTCVAGTDRYSVPVRGFVPVRGTVRARAKDRFYRHGQPMTLCGGGAPLRALLAQTQMVKQAG
jgi:hypothetical protein